MADKHHIYLTEGPTKIMTRAIHMKLHRKAYEYILERFGKEEIDKYIVWFGEKFGFDKTIQE